MLADLLVTYITVDSSVNEYVGVMSATALVLNLESGEPWFRPGFLSH